MHVTTSGVSIVRQVLKDAEVALKLKSQVRARSTVQVLIARYERQSASRFITRHVKIESIT